MGQPQAHEQEPHTRPTGSGELAQHSETGRFSPGGKCGGCVAEIRALTCESRVLAKPFTRGRSVRHGAPPSGRERPGQQWSG